MWRRYNIFAQSHESCLHQSRINVNLFVQYKLEQQTITVENT
jgi:hypothetical protein